MVELHLAAHPPASSGGFREQAREAYAGLHRVLVREGFQPADLLTERIFVSDIGRQFDTLECLRSETYSGLGLSPENRPAATFLQQPPCEPGRAVEIQALAVACRSKSGISRSSIPGLPGLASGKVVAHDGLRHVYLANITGSGEGDVPFRDQAQRMLERAKACLDRAGVAFDDVVRSWIYISDIEADYEAFNRLRTSFYSGLGLKRIPASTGIQGGTYPQHAGCSMDLYALASSPAASIDVMHASTMNEALSYGSSFSRGMAVESGGKRTAYVSGTASIDEAGNVLHSGDVGAQARRMLDNVEALLDGSGAGFGDVVSATTYLKFPESLPAFREAWTARGLPADIPNTVTMADVCRPEWLCEIEAIAIY